MIFGTKGTMQVDYEDITSEKQSRKKMQKVVK